MDISRTVMIRRDVADVWALVEDVSRYPDFFRGVTRWQPCSEQMTGVGACFRVLMQVGSIEAGGTICTTEWEAGERISWRAQRGIDQRGSWRLESVAGGTRLTLQVGFSLAGPFRWPVERLAGRIVARHLFATLLAARRLVEVPSASPQGGIPG